MAFSRKADVESGVYQSLLVQALAGTGALEQIHCAFLEHAGPYPAQYVIAAATLEDDAIDAGVM